MRSLHFVIAARECVDLVPMPDPDYAGRGDHPGFWGCFAIALLLFVVFLVVQSC